MQWEGYGLELGDATLEPGSNLSNVAAELRAYLAMRKAMPKPGAFGVQSGCCHYGAACRNKNTDLSMNGCRMCDKPVHHMCFIDNPMIAKLAAEFELGSWCFDCALLAGVIREKVPSQYSAPYYAQLTDWSAESASTPFAVGALLSSGSLKLSKDCAAAKCARVAVDGATCHACKAGGDAPLLACSYCNKDFHNTEACLGAAASVLPAGLVSKKQESFAWACPKCLKKATTAHQKKLLQPASQAAPGAKRKRGRGRAR